MKKKWEKKIKDNEKKEKKEKESIAYYGAYAVHQSSHDNDPIGSKYGTKIKLTNSGNLVKNFLIRKFLNQSSVVKNNTKTL